MGVQGVSFNMATNGAYDAVAKSIETVSKLPMEILDKKLDLTNKMVKVSVATKVATQKGNNIDFVV